MGVGMNKLFRLLTAVIFLWTSLVPPSVAEGVSLPAAQSMIMLTPDFSPCLLRGIRLDPKMPLRFEFIVDEGDTHLKSAAFEDEAERLIKYFMATLTTPEKDLWVNLSPYENDRIVQENFGRTAMGRDLLAQDYILKQLTASLMHPDGELGKKFWGGVYRQAQEKFGTTDIPIDTFNKVWIVPEYADVYEKKNQDGTMAAFVDKARLKVMLESDYLAKARDESQEAETVDAASSQGTQEMAQEVVRSVILPALEKEVNQGSHFAQLRQVYHSLLLAVWLKKKLQTAGTGRDSVQNPKGNILSLLFVDKKKTNGIETNDPKGEITNIYERYVEAFKTGAYNLIREDYDLYSKEVIPRKYFSGGAEFGGAERALSIRPASSLPESVMKQGKRVTADFAMASMKKKKARHPFRTFFASTISVAVVLVSGIGIMKLMDRGNVGSDGAPLSEQAAWSAASAVTGAVNPTETSRQAMDVRFDMGDGQAFLQEISAAVNRFEDMRAGRPNMGNMTPERIIRNFRNHGKDLTDANHRALLSKIVNDWCDKEPSLLRIFGSREAVARNLFFTAFVESTLGEAKGPIWHILPDTLKDLEATYPELKDFHPDDYNVVLGKMASLSRIADFFYPSMSDIYKRILVIGTYNYGSRAFYREVSGQNLGLMLLSAILADNPDMYQGMTPLDSIDKELRPALKRMVTYTLNILKTSDVHVWRSATVETLAAEAGYYAIPSGAWTITAARKGTSLTLDQVVENLGVFPSQVKFLDGPGNIGGRVLIPKEKQWVFKYKIKGYWDSERSFGRFVNARFKNLLKGKSPEEVKKWSEAIQSIILYQNNFSSVDALNKSGGFYVPSERALLQPVYAPDVSGVVRFPMVEGRPVESTPSLHKVQRSVVGSPGKKGRAERAMRIESPKAAEPVMKVEVQVLAEIAAGERLALNDLFTPENEIKQIIQSGSEKMVYHLTSLDSISFILRYGFYSTIGRAILNEKIKTTTPGSGSVILAFKVPVENVEDATDGTGLALSRNVSKSIPPELIEDLKRNYTGENKALVSILEQMAASGNAGYFDPDLIDWKETLRATAIYNLEMEGKFWPTSLERIAPAIRPEMKREDLARYLEEWGNRFKVLITKYKRYKGAVSEADSGSAVKIGEPSDLGGIDLNTDRLDMFIKGNAGNFDMELTPEDLQMLQQGVTGFVPVIIGVNPLESVPGFLGMREVSEKPLT